MTHELKILPQFYERVKDGSKTFEVRKNDRGFQKGDFVILREWDSQLERDASGQPVAGFVDSEALTFRIGYVLPLNEKHGESRVVFSLLPSPLP
jgi:Domain of unknown function (DUF3850)